MAFTEEFSKDAQKQIQWRAFVRKSKPEDISRDFETVIGDVRVFLMPVLEIARGDDHFELSWPGGGSWE
jgi:hypothetical protein